MQPLIEAVDKEKGIDIVAIPGIGEGLQDFDSDLFNPIWHEQTLRFDVQLRPLPS